MPNARFCSSEVVRAAIEGKRVALVGSGPGCLDNPPGYVDSHDVVVRVNNFKTVPGSGTGMRTDLYYSFFGNSIKKSVAELKSGGVHLCICKCPNGQFIDSPWHRINRKMAGVDFSYIYKARESWWFCPTYVPTIPEFLKHFEMLGRHVPTTGFSALLTILEYNPRNIFVTGMDFFQSGVHNVNEQWRAGHPGDPIGHAPEAERAWFAKNFQSLPITMDAMLSKAVDNRVQQMMKPLPAVHPRQVRFKRP